MMSKRYPAYVLVIAFGPVDHWIAERLKWMVIWWWRFTGLRGHHLANLLLCLGGGQWIAYAFELAVFDHRPGTALIWLPSMVVFIASGIIHRTSFAFAEERPPLLPPRLHVRANSGLRRLCLCGASLHLALTLAGAERHELFAGFLLMALSRYASGTFVSGGPSIRERLKQYWEARSRRVALRPASAAGLGLDAAEPHLVLVLRPQA